MLIIAVLIFVGYWAKLFIDRNRNIKKAEGNMWVQIVPKAGLEHNYMVPIKNDNGVTYVRIPDSNGKYMDNSPVHVVGEPGVFNAVWPPGKSKYVQLPVSKIIYYEGDTEPLSNVSDRPIVSSQLFANVVDGVASSTSDAMRKSFEDSLEGKSLKRSNPMLWVYIILGVVVVLGIVNLVLNIQGLSAVDMVKDLTKLIQQALGLK